MKDTALILEGGGMRGVYTAGVLDFLLDQDVHIKTIYGVSAGACHACSYLSRQRGRAVRTVVDFLEDPRYAGTRSFIRTGDYFGVQMIYDEIPNRLLPFDYDAMASSGATFYGVLTNCRTGKPEYHRINDMRKDIKVVQASSSLPLLSRMVELNGSKYLDGGMSDSIPIGRSVGDGNRRHLVILTQHQGFQKQSAGMVGAMKVRYLRYPALVECYQKRHQQYNASLALAHKLSKQGSAMVLQPASPVTIDRLERDKDKLMALYRTGYDETAARWEELRSFLTA